MYLLFGAASTGVVLFRLLRISQNGLPHDASLCAVCNYNLLPCRVHSGARVHISYRSSSSSEIICSLATDTNRRSGCCRRPLLSWHRMHLCVLPCSIIFISVISTHISGPPTRIQPNTHLYSIIMCANRTRWWATHLPILALDITYEPLCFGGSDLKYYVVVCRLWAPQESIVPLTDAPSGNVCATTNLPGFHKY